MKEIIFLFIISLLIMLGSNGCSNGDNPSTQQQSETNISNTASGTWVTGYYVMYERDMLPPEEIDWSGLTHIVVARVLANSDGTLNTNFDYDPTNGPALAKDIAVRAHTAGKKAILMLGGAGNGVQIRDALTNHRTQFISNLISAMNTYGYDGLDLDWEDNIDMDLFILFAKELRQAAPNAILTLPGGPLNINYDTVDPKLVEVIQYIDQFNLMSYYPTTSWSGSGWYSWHNSPLSGVKPTTPVSIDDSLDRYVKAGVPKEKLGMGVGFYTICYNGGITAPNQSTENGVSIVGGDHEYPLSELFGTNGAYDETSRFWDNDAKASYLSLSQSERHGCRYVSFEDEESLIAKGDFTRNNKYGGIIIWTINQGHVRSHSQPNFLFQALRKGFIEPNFQRKVGISIMQGNSWLKTSSTMQLRALITGTSNKSLIWSITTPNCGSITANGLYTAPATEKTCSVRAVSTADSTQIADANMTITNVEWTPQFDISRTGTHWVEIAAKDKDVISLSFDLTDGTTQAISLNYTDYLGYPHFATNFGFPTGGGTYTFHAKSANNRSANINLNIPVCSPNSEGICQ
ncbi:MAG: glycoside hydrolase family 18 protein [Sulfuricurvum sp.]|uniref:glycosyl hydrolase family 18 protein n=1 Tax=Sulfuricurvum sp. TaxID=2025608 RepID=UPI00262EE786|nr:glycoside hydrolase family 18 protein [Sulfuricurvum sp.]MDD2828793.1 glycoside hydrolase family 18 protein [Sulfuricurvum sp.]MDD4948748.1 glycoside hydrolase family 18 protein [Sulfuricurvum sp.]